MLRSLVSISCALSVFALILTACTSPAPAPSPEEESARLNERFETYFEEFLELNPLLTLEVGGHTDDTLLNVVDRASFVDIKD